MLYRPIKSEPNDRRLGRYIPSNFEHVEKYPLSSAMAETMTPTPVVIGINWYSNFDNPKDNAGNSYYPGRVPVGNWWIGRGSLGSIRGGHAVALKQRYASDLAGWWDFYNQGREGACVGFAASRVMTLINRKRYFARWLWDRSKEIDPWSETNPGDDEGTDVNSALKILRDRGHVNWNLTKHASMNDEPTDWVQRKSLVPTLAEGIVRYRWITSIDDMLNVLGYGGKDYVDILNSWGRSYPHLVRCPATVMDRLWREYGEIAVITDR
jgi:hypothetical protein